MSKNPNDFEAILIDNVKVDESSVKKFKEDIAKRTGADPNCKACNGYGKVNVGSICTGFGAEPESIECMCITYRKIGIDPETGEKIK